MIEKTIPLAITVVMLASLPISTAMAQPPMPPCWFYGTASVEGMPAQDNLNVTATIRGTNLTWTTKTKNGTYGWTNRGSTSFYIPSDDPMTPDKDGGVDGDIIEFSLNGTKTKQTATFEFMNLKKVDLAVGSNTGGNGPTFNPHLLYTLAIVIAIGIGLAAVLWIHRKGYRIKVLRKPKQKTTIFDSSSRYCYATETEQNPICL